jgi:hypothetical protein
LSPVSQTINTSSDHSLLSFFVGHFCFFARYMSLGQSTVCLLADLHQKSAGLRNLADLIEVVSAAPLCAL